MFTKACFNLLILKTKIEEVPILFPSPGLFDPRVHRGIATKTPNQRSELYSEKKLIRSRTDES
jgi:hypothetical protein